MFFHLIRGKMKKIVGVFIIILSGMLIYFHPYYYRIKHKFFPPMVSVVIPTYNREKLLPRAIDSILKQTYKDFEIIVVDDGSFDDTAKILKTYQRRYGKVKVVTHEIKKGVSEARNSGNKIALGKYIALIDSDDYALENYLEIAVDFMEQNPNVTIGIPNKNGYYETKDQPIYYPKTIPMNHSFLYFLNASRIGNVGNIFRRDFVVKHNIQYKKEFNCAEDYDFWLQMILKGATLAKIESKEGLVVMRVLGGLSRLYSCVSSSDKIKKEFRKKVGYIVTDEQYDFCEAISKTLEKLPNVFIEPELSKLKKICPLPTDKFIKVVHSKWRDYFIFLSDETKIYRLGKAHDKANVLTFIPNEKITIEWDGWGEETFIYQEKYKAYILENMDTKK